MPTTPGEFGAYLTRYAQPATEGFGVCVRDGGAMAGVITIDSIVRGRFQSASVSYAAFASAAGQGYMAEGLALVLEYAFTELRLHRLEANIQPGNQPSLRLVQRLGFRRRATPPAMLFIDGAWRDHERWAITVEMTGFGPVAPHPTHRRPGRQGSADVEDAEAQGHAEAGDDPEADDDGGLGPARPARSGAAAGPSGTPVCRSA